MPVALVATVVVLALVVSILGGWFAVMGVLRLAARSADAGAPGGDPRRPPAHARGAGQDPANRPVITPLAVSDGPEGLGARAVLRGGTWIGALERLAVTACMLVGQPEGIAVVIAVKGLGRYPELRENPGASERFVIGTLASLLWAAGVGYGAQLLIS